MRFSLVDDLDYLIEMSDEATLDSVRKLSNHLLDPPYTIVYLEVGTPLMEWQGWAHRDRERPICASIKVSCYYIADKDGCLWARGSKEALEGNLALMAMIQGTAAGEDIEPFSVAELS